MLLYAMYVFNVVLVFIVTLLNDKVQFAILFLLPFLPVPLIPGPGPLGYFERIENLWDSRDSLSGPWPWLAGLLIWFTFGLEVYLGGVVFCLSAGRWWPNAFVLLLMIKWLCGMVCGCLCLIQGREHFWNLAGAFLGLMSFFGFCFLQIYYHCSRRGMRPDTESPHFFGRFFNFYHNV